MLRTGVILMLATLLLSIIGCSSDGNNAVNSSGNETLPDTISFTKNVKPILTVSCAKSGCHGSGSSAGGFTMGSVTRAEIIAASGFNGPIVKVNDSTSNLYRKTTANPPFGARMPQDGPPYLSDIKQLTIRNWILQGAKDN